MVISMSKRTENDVLNGDGWNKDETSDSPEIKSIPEVGVKQGISIFFTLIVIIAIGAFIVKGYKASKNPESDTVAEQTTAETTDSVISVDDLGSDRDESGADDQKEQIIKDYFCYMADTRGFTLVDDDPYYNEHHPDDYVIEVSTISDDDSLQEIDIKGKNDYKISTAFDKYCTSDIYCFFPYKEDVFDGTYKDGVTFTKEWLCGVIENNDLLLEGQIILKEMDDSHIVIEKVNLTYHFDEYSKLQTGEGIRYQTSDGTRYELLLDVPHTVDIEETGEVLTLYSELEIN